MTNATDDALSDERLRMLLALINSGDDYGRVALERQGPDLAAEVLTLRQDNERLRAENEALKLKKAARENAGHYRGGSFDPS